MQVQWDDLDPKLVQIVVERIAKAARIEVDRRFGSSNISAGEVAEQLVFDALRTIIGFDVEYQPGRCPIAIVFRPTGDVQNLGPTILGSQQVGPEVTDK